MISRFLAALLLLCMFAFAQSSSSSSSVSSSSTQIQLSLTRPDFWPDSYWPADFWPKPYWPESFWPSSSSTVTSSGSGGISSSSGSSSSSSIASSSSSFVLTQKHCDVFIQDRIRIAYSYQPVHYVEGVGELKNPLTIKKGTGSCGDFNSSILDFDKRRPHQPSLDVAVEFYKYLGYDPSNIRSWARTKRTFDYAEGRTFIFGYDPYGEVENLSGIGMGWNVDYDYNYEPYPNQYRDTTGYEVFRQSNYNGFRTVAIRYQYSYSVLAKREPHSLVYDEALEHGMELCIEVPTGCNVEICDNAMDDNGDNFTDCDDPQCVNSTTCLPPVVYPEVFCADGNDNDADGRYDCQDTDCSLDAACTSQKVCSTQSDCSDPACAFTDFCQPQNACNTMDPDCSNPACALEEACVPQLQDSIQLCNSDDPDEHCPGNSCSDGLGNAGEKSCASVSPIQLADGEPVSVSDGSLYMERSDIGLAQSDIFWIQPYYNSLWNHFSAFGHGWNSILDVRLLPKAGGGWILRGEYGQKETFSAQGKNLAHRLTQYDMDSIAGGKRIRMARDRWYEFDVSGLLVRISNAKGEAVGLNYDVTDRVLIRQGISGNGFPAAQPGQVAMGYRLASVVNEKVPTDALHFEYNSSGYVSRIEDNAGRYVAYQYDDAGNLLRAEKPVGDGSSLFSHYVFTVPEKHQINKFTSSWVGCERCTDTKDWVLDSFDLQGRVAMQRYADRRFSFKYDATDAVGNGAYTKVTAVRLDSEGKETSEQTTHWYANSSQGTGTNREYTIKSMVGYDEPSIIGSQNRYTKSVQFVFDAQNRVKYEYDERGRWVVYSRDSQGRITSRYTLAGSDTLFFLHKEYDPATGLESLRLEGGYKIRRDTVKTTYEYYTAGNSGLLRSEKIWQDDSHYSETYYEYTTAGVLAKRVNPDGSVDEYAFSGSDLRNPVSRSLNGHVVETYLERDFAGRVTKMQNAEGQTASRSYDLLGRLIESCDYENNCTKNVYEGRNLVSSTRGKTATESGITAYYTHDGLGRVTHEYGVDNHGDKVLVRTTAYDADGNATEVRDAAHQSGNANETNLFSLEGGRLLKSTDGEGNAHLWQYDFAGNRTASLDPAGNVTYMYYDFEGRMVGRVAPDHGSESWGYDSRGNLLYHVDPLDRKTYYDYNAMNKEVIRIGAILDTVYTDYDTHGRLSKHRSAEGVYDYYQYNASGQLWRIVHKVDDTLSTADGNDLIDQYSYDLYGRQTVARQGRLDSLVTVSTRSYDGNGRVRTETNALGQTTTYHYFGHGGIRSIVFHGGDSTTYAYDAMGRRTSEYFNEELQSQIVYDNAGRVAERKILGGDTLLYAYNGSSQVVSITDGEGRVTGFQYDASGNVAQVTDPAGKMIRTLHDAMGRDSVRIDPMGNSTQVYYDLLGRQVEMKVNDSSRVKYYYMDQRNTSLVVTVLHGANAVLEWRNRDGVLYERSQGPNSARYTFDSRGRVSKRSTQADTLQNAVRYTYNLLGQLESATGDSGIVERYQSDMLGRPLQAVLSVDGADYTTHYSYDDSARTVTEMLPSGTLRSRSLDVRGRLAAQLFDDDTVATYQWQGSQLKSRVLGNGIALTRSWDGSGKENDLSYMKGTTELLALALVRDAVGAVASVARSPWQDADETFGYRDDRQLEQHGSAQASTMWTLAGGLGYVAGVTRTAQGGGISGETRTTHPYANQTDTVAYRDGGSFTVDYDQNGRITGMDGASYQWNADQQLSRAGGASYRYDSFGRLVRKATAGGTVTYLYDGPQVVEEIHGDGSSKTFAWGIYMDEPVAVKRTTPYGVASVTYPLSGLNHNVEAVADAQGNLVERYRISPYGSVEILIAGADGVVGTTDDVESGVSLVGNDLFFQGRPYDADAGLYNIRARWYSPKLMKWMSNDPLLFGAGDVNLGRFVGNDPINRVDPSGLVSSTNSCDMSPWELGVEWLTGNDRPTHRDFGAGCSMTEDLRKHSFMIEFKQRLLEEAKKNCKNCNEKNITRSGAYSLSGIEGVPKYVRDYSTLLTGGLTGNLTVTFLGSYGVNATVSDVNCKAGTAKASYIVNNSSTFASATRPPVLGYTEFWQQHVAPAINNAIQEGAASTITQTFTWDENLSFGGN